MPTYDVLCGRCGVQGEMSCPYEERNHQPCPWCHLAYLNIVWKTFPGMKIQASDIYDLQLGKRFKTERERQEYAKQQDLVEVPRKEFLEKAATVSEPQGLSGAELRDVMEENWERAHAGTLPPIKHRKMDEGIDTSKILNQNGEPDGGYLDRL